jgi:hypothetical protein
MAELEQELGRLPEDPAFAPEPFPAVAARAAERRRRRWQGRGAALVVAAVVVVTGVAAVSSSGGRPQVVDIAGGGGRGPGVAPATPSGGRTPPAASPGDVVPGDLTPGEAVPPVAPEDEGGTTTTPAPSNPGDTVPAGNVPLEADGSQSSPVQPDPDQQILPPTVDPSLDVCTAGQVSTTVVTDKATYAPGEPVRATATIRNHSATACLVPTRAFMEIRASSGGLVSGFAYTADYRFPVKAEPGQAFTDGVTWDGRDCSMPVCSQPAPPGTYQVVARWTEGAQFGAQGSFEIA